MNNHNTILPASPPAWQTILLAGVVAGILDAIAAMISTTLATGRGPDVVWKFVASGAFGVEKAFATDSATVMVLAGLLFHMFFAMMWTIVFFYIYPLLKGTGRHFVLVGLLYGIIVWCGMNLVIVPLSNTPKSPATTSGVIKSMAFLMICVGLPISFFVNRHYLRRNGRN